MDDVTYTWTIEPEEETYVGNCMASGVERLDREQEEWVRSQLARGNEAAWCVFVVKAERNGVKGHAAIGCCSYTSVENLLDCLLDEMKEEALADLVRIEQDKASHIDVRPVIAFITENTVETNGKFFVDVLDLYKKLSDLGVKNEVIDNLLKSKE